MTVRKGLTEPLGSILLIFMAKMVMTLYLLIYMGFSVAFNTVQVISQWRVLWTEETSTYSWPRFCTVKCWPSVRNYQLSHIESGIWTADLRGGRWVCYHYAIVAPMNFFYKAMQQCPRLQVLVLQVNRDCSFSMLDGSPRGGKAFHGLGSLLTGAKVC